MRKLKKYNGGQIYTNKFNRCHFYVLATSMKHCAELIAQATESSMQVSTIRDYWNKDAWGNAMQGINETEPCVYYTEANDRDPKKLL